MQSGRVQEPHPAEIEDETREAGGAQLDELGLDRRHRGKVELADGTNVDGGAARLDLTAKRLDLRTGERHGTSFHGGYEEVRRPPCRGPGCCLPVTASSARGRRIGPSGSLPPRAAGGARQPVGRLTATPPGSSAVSHAGGRGLDVATHAFG